MSYLDERRAVAALSGLSEESWWTKVVSASLFEGNIRRRQVLIPAVGVEIEAEAASARSFLAVAEALNCTVVNDGSLRGGGLEFITRASSLEDTERTVRQFYSDIFPSRGPSRASASARTSTHVHLDARGLSVNELLAVCTLYSLFEPFLFAKYAPERRANLYCVPWYNSNAYVELLSSLQRIKPTQPARHGRVYDAMAVARLLRHNPGLKYSALNLRPMLTQGSIEFRLAPTFTQVSQLLDFIRRCHWLLEKGQELGNPTAVYDWVNTPDFLRQDFDGREVISLCDKFDGWNTAEALYVQRKHCWDDPVDYSARRRVPREKKKERPIAGRKAKLTVTDDFGAAMAAQEWRVMTTTALYEDLRRRLHEPPEEEAAENAFNRNRTDTVHVPNNREEDV